MFYTYRNTDITINEKKLFVDKIDITQSTSLEDLYLNNEKNSFKSSPVNNISTSIKLSYFLTGQDVFKPYFTDETTSIKGNFAGLTFDEAYLKNYQIVFDPNSPAKAEVELVYFDALQGTFSPTSSEYPNSEILNFNNIIISQSDDTTENLTNITNGSFTFNSEITPAYYVNNTIGLTNFKPDRVVFGKKEITTELTTDSLTSSLPIYGVDANLTIQLVHPTNSLFNEEFFCSGILHERKLSVNKDGILQSLVSVKQNRVGKPPAITSFTTLDNFVSVFGNNFGDVMSLSVGGKDIKNYTIISTGELNFTITPDLSSGKILINTWEGSSASTGNLPVSYLDMSVDSFSPNKVSAGQEVTILGQNFFDVDSVKVGGENISFSVWDQNRIHAIARERLPLGKIEVSSSARSLTSISTDMLFTPPYIDTFGPQTGIVGTSIVISGANISGISNVYFNGINTSYSVSNTGFLNTSVPTGNVYGPVSIKNSGEYSASSTFSFIPSVLLTGISPSSGKSLTPLSILGSNFVSNYLYPFDSGSYGVMIGGVQTGFVLVSSILLTGLVPHYSASGNVFINKPDGVSVYASLETFNKLPDAPVVTSLSPNTLVSGNSFWMSVGGTGLNQSNQIILSGISASNSGNQIVIWDKNHAGGGNTSVLRNLNTSLSNDLLGTRSNIYHTLASPGSLTDNAFLTGIATGVYNAFVINDAGTGLYVSGITITELPLISRGASTYLTKSSYSTGSYYSTGIYSVDPFGVGKVVDGITGSGYCSTSGEINPYLTMNFGGLMQIHKIDLWPRSEVNYFSDSGAFTQWAEIQLFKTGLAIQSGNATFGAGVHFTTGYTQSFITSMPSWRWEADAVKFIAHRQSASVDVSTYFQMSEIEVRGITV